MAMDQDQPAERKIDFLIRRQPRAGIVAIPTNGIDRNLKGFKIVQSLLASHIPRVEYSVGLGESPEDSWVQRAVGVCYEAISVAGHGGGFSF